MQENEQKTKREKLIEKEKILFGRVAKWFTYCYGNLHILATDCWYYAGMIQ